MSLLEESKAITDELEQHIELHDKIDAIVNAKFFDLMSKNVKESDAVSGAQKYVLDKFETYYFYCPFCAREIVNE